MKIDLKCILAIASIVFASCYLPAQQPVRPAFSADATAERIPNLDTLKKELRQYHDCTCTCGCYAHDIEAQANRGIAFLRRRAAHRTISGNSAPQEKLVLILDIDETTLSNYKELVDSDFAYNPAVFDAWVETAQAPAIPGTLRLYKEAQRLGVSVFFITGRPELERAATERNLRAVGFDNWQELVMRPAAHGPETIGAYKAVVRGRIAAEGYTLILNAGDQWSDLKGKPEAEFSVKYPDPFYVIP